MPINNFEIWQTNVKFVIVTLFFLTQHRRLLFSELFSLDRPMFSTMQTLLSNDMYLKSIESDGVFSNVKHNNE